VPEKLKLYLEGKIEESCSTKPSYIARVKLDLVKSVVGKLREKCDELKTIGGVMFKCSKNEGRITFTVGNGRLVVEASNAEEALRLLEDILA
jgi:hypothetical protein